MSWNSMKIDPPVAGVYELMKNNKDLSYAYWTGAYWGMCNMIPYNVSTSSTQAKGNSCYNGKIVAWRDMNAVSSATVVGGNRAPVVPAPLPVPAVGSNWVPMSASPTETGVYQMKFGPRCEYSFWNGSYWTVATGNLSTALALKSSTARSTSCYDGTITGWRKIAGYVYTPSAHTSPPPIPTQALAVKVSGQWPIPPSSPSPPGFFPMDQKPFISGVYLISSAYGQTYCYWNNENQFWSYCEATEHGASLHPNEKGLDCYDPGQTNGWKYITAMDATGIANKKSKKPKEFTPDEIKPELMTKRVRDWL